MSLSSYREIQFNEILEDETKIEKIIDPLSYILESSIKQTNQTVRTKPRSIPISNREEALKLLVKFKQLSIIERVYTLEWILPTSFSKEAQIKEIRVCLDLEKLIRSQKPSMFPISLPLQTWLTVKLPSPNTTRGGKAAVERKFQAGYNTYYKRRKRRSKISKTAHPKRFPVLGPPVPKRGKQCS